MRAVYTSFISAWKDRVDWDGKAGAVVNRNQTCEQYINACMSAGWFGTEGGLPIIRSGYPQAVAMSLGGEDGFGVLAAIMGGAWKLVGALLAIGFVVTAILCLLWMAWNKMRRKG